VIDWIRIELSSGKAIVHTNLPVPIAPIARRLLNGGHPKILLLLLPFAGIEGLILQSVIGSLNR
jgi:hypothetical protein